jgi:hypothetical protein
LTWPEFKRDPFGFVKRSVQGYGQMVGKFFGKRDAVLAILNRVWCDRRFDWVARAD